jgi:hypothetical protein
MGHSDRLWERPVYGQGQSSPTRSRNSRRNPVCFPKFMSHAFEVVEGFISNDTVCTPQMRMVCLVTSYILGGGSLNGNWRNRGVSRQARPQFGLVSYAGMNLILISTRLERLSYLPLYWFSFVVGWSHQGE